jgi:hypothetical protein
VDEAEADCRAEQSATSLAVARAIDLLDAVEEQARTMRDLLGGGSVDGPTAAGAIVCIGRAAEALDRSNLGLAARRLRQEHSGLWPEGKRR